jgi:hypothetical protein
MKTLNFNRWTKLPIVPVYGGFPVKLRTHVGRPIHPDDFENVEQFREAILQVSAFLFGFHLDLTISKIILADVPEIS